MTFADVVVIVLGVGFIGWELWYFLFPAARDDAPAQGGVQDIRVVVKNGYDPSTIMVEAGRPVRLHFYRDETVECSERVVFESLGIEESLAAYATTTVEFIPSQPGDYPFRCGKSVMHGRVVAQLGREAARLNLGRGHVKHG
ncbi:MAG TPA: cupredoxin domain-containing protein [Gemmatimonadales bacterium]